MNKTSSQLSNQEAISPITSLNKNMAVSTMLQEQLDQYEQKVLKPQGLAFPTLEQSAEYNFMIRQAETVSNYEKNPEDEFLSASLINTVKDNYDMFRGLSYSNLRSMYHGMTPQEQAKVMYDQLKGNGVRQNLDDDNPLSKVLDADALFEGKDDFERELYLGNIALGERTWGYIKDVTIGEDADWLRDDIDFLNDNKDILKTYADHYGTEDINRLLSRLDELSLEEKKTRSDKSITVGHWVEPNRGEKKRPTIREQDIEEEFSPELLQQIKEDIKIIKAGRRYRQKAYDKNTWYKVQGFGMDLLMAKDGDKALELANEYLERVGVEQSPLEQIAAPTNQMGITGFRSHSDLLKRFSELPIETQRKFANYVHNAKWGGRQSFVGKTVGSFAKAVVEMATDSVGFIADAGVRVFASTLMNSEDYQWYAERNALLDLVDEYKYEDINFPAGGLLDLGAEAISSAANSVLVYGMLLSNPLTLVGVAGSNARQNERRIVLAGGDVSNFGFGILNAGVGLADVGTEFIPAMKYKNLVGANFRNKGFLRNFIKYGFSEGIQEGYSGALNEGWFAANTGGNVLDSAIKGGISSAVQSLPSLGIAGLARGGMNYISTRRNIIKNLSGNENFPELLKHLDNRAKFARYIHEEETKDKASFEDVLAREDMTLEDWDKIKKSYEEADLEGGNIFKGLVNQIAENNFSPAYLRDKYGYTEEQSKVLAGMFSNINTELQSQLRDDPKAQKAFLGQRYETNARVITEQLAASTTPGASYELRIRDDEDGDGFWMEFKGKDNKGNDVEERVHVITQDSFTLNDKIDINAAEHDIQNQVEKLLSFQKAGGRLTSGNVELLNDWNTYKEESLKTNVLRWRKNLLLEFMNKHGLDIRGATARGVAKNDFLGISEETYIVLNKDAMIGTTLEHERGHATYRIAKARGWLNPNLEQDLQTLFPPLKDNEAFNEEALMVTLEASTPYEALIKKSVGKKISNAMEGFWNSLLRKMKITRAEEAKSDRLYTLFCEGNIDEVKRQVEIEEAYKKYLINGKKIDSQQATEETNKRDTKAEATEEQAVRDEAAIRAGVSEYFEGTKEDAPQEDTTTAEDVVKDGEEVIKDASKEDVKDASLETPPVGEKKDVKIKSEAVTFKELYKDNKFVEIFDTLDKYSATHKVKPDIEKKFLSRGLTIVNTKRDGLVTISFNMPLQNGYFPRNKKGVSVLEQGANNPVTKISQALGGFKNPASTRLSSLFWSAYTKDGKAKATYNRSTKEYVIASTSDKDGDVESIVMTPTDNGYTFTATYKPISDNAPDTGIGVYEVVENGSRSVVDLRDIFEMDDLGEDSDLTNTLTNNGETQYPFSSISTSFFGETLTLKDFVLKDYKDSQGYKDYVNTCLNNIKQVQGEKFRKASAKAEIEKSIEGIVRVAIAMKRAGYDIEDDASVRDLKDSEGRLLFSSLEPNDDYFTSSDISAICDKKRNFQEIYDEIVRIEERLGRPKEKRFFSKIDNFFIIHKILADKGLTQPCKQCYVESMRKNLAPMANSFIKLIRETDLENKKNDSLYQRNGKKKVNNFKARANALKALDSYGMSVEEITIELLTTADGLARLKIQAPLVYQVFNSYYGQSKPKMPKKAVPFRFGELTALLTDDKGKIKQSLIKKINSTGGFRFQSYSDFQIQNFVDVLQVIFEAGTLGLRGHAYTKVPSFLEATKGTNLKRNMSIFMYMDEDGRWVLDENDSFPMSLEDMYNLQDKDTGIIAVSQNEKMSAWIMVNPNISYAIPFHKSGNKMATVRDTDVRTKDGRIIKGYAQIKDHSKQQNETWASTTNNHKAGTKVSKAINIYEFWDFENKKGLSSEKLEQKNIKSYIDKCIELGYRPKFVELLNNDKVFGYMLRYGKEEGWLSEEATIKDITWKYKGYVIPYGYQAFLGDFAKVTPQGKSVGFKPLSLKDYDFDSAVRFFENTEEVRRNEILQQFSNGYLREEMRNSGKTIDELSEEISIRRQQVINEIVESETQYNIGFSNMDMASLDSLYLDAVERGDVETMRRMVDEAAKRAGYTYKAYHGTPDFGWTKPKTEMVYLSSSINIAKAFAGGGGIRYITSNKVQTISEAIDIIQNEFYFRNLNIRPIAINFIDTLIEEEKKDIEEVKSNPSLSGFLDMHLRKLEYYENARKRFLDGEKYYTADDWGRPVMSEESLIDEANEYLEENADSTYATYGMYVNTNNAIEIDANGAVWNEVPVPKKLKPYADGYKHLNTDDIARVAKMAGYDVAIIHNVREGTSPSMQKEKATDYVVTSPSQIKSADPVTYDNDGNVIPLSQRFDVTNPDIRYSIAGIKGATALDAYEEGTRRLDNLAIAKEMERDLSPDWKKKDDENALKIKLATGWEKGVDGKWRYELPDDINQDAILHKSKIGNVVKFNLGDVLADDNILLKAYPELRELRIIEDPSLPALEAAYHHDEDEIFRYIRLSSIYFSPILSAEHEAELQQLRDAKAQKEKALKEKFDEDSKEYSSAWREEIRPLVYEINDKEVEFGKEDGKKKNEYKLDGARSTILHEVQHAIQRIEGFANGGAFATLYPEAQRKVDEIEAEIALLEEKERTFKTPKERWSPAYKSLKKEIDFLYDTIKEIKSSSAVGIGGYHRLAGEVEARNVASRLDLTPEQRREQLLADTEDVAREDQIIIGDLLEGASVSNRMQEEEVSRNISEANLNQKKPNTIFLQDENFVLDTSLADDTQYSITARNFATIQGWLNKRSDLSDLQKTAVLQFITDIDEPRERVPNNNTLQLAIGKWYAQGVIKLPDDYEKCVQAVRIALNKRVDPLSKTYKTPAEIIDALGEKSVEPPINPDTIETFHLDKTMLNGRVKIYNVDDSDEPTEKSETSRMNCRKAINTHFGVSANPWCLLQGDGFGGLSGNSKTAWYDNYNAYPKQIIFVDDKLAAFNANSESQELFWDRNDEAHEGVPVAERIPNDKLKRWTLVVYDKNTEEEIRRIGKFKGNKMNGRYQEWNDDDILIYDGEFKRGNMIGTHKEWDDNGQIHSETTYKLVQYTREELIRDAEMSGTLDRDLPRINAMADEDLPYESVQDGSYKVWHDNGQLRVETTYKNGKKDGSYKVWHDNGQLEVEATYKDGELDGSYKRWFSNGQLMEETTYKDGEKDGSYKIWRPNGQLRVEATYKNGVLDGSYKRWFSNGQLREEATYKNGVKVNSDTQYSIQFRETSPLSITSGGMGENSTRLDDSSSYSISSFGASLNSLYGAKNTPSKNSMLIGIAVEDKLKDKIYAPEHYENLAKMLGSKLTGEEVLTARDSYLENKTEKDIKSLKRNPTFRTIARDFERGAIENLATDIITKGVLQGIALNENVEQAKQKALNNVVDSLRGLTNEQWQKQSGIDFVSTILNIPVVWRHKVGNEEDKEDKLKLINKWNLVTGPLTPEEQAVFDAEQSRLNSLADIILTEFNLLRDAANEKRRQRAAIQRERVENYRATPREEDSTDRMLREMAEDNWINKPRAEFDIPIELLQKHQFGVNDIGEMFILFKVSFARYLVAKGMAENSETAFDNKVNLVEFAKSMQNILFSLCDEMLDPITSPKAFVRVNKIIASIPTGERVSMKTLQQRSVIALHRLHRSGIKDLKKHLINNLIKDIKHFAIKGSSLDQTMSDLKRKVSGKLEQEAKWIIAFVQMSKNAVARAKEKYATTKAKREAEYEASESKLDVRDDVEWQIADRKLNLINAYGALKHESVQTIREKTQSIIEWLQEGFNHHQEMINKRQHYNDLMAKILVDSLNTIQSTTPNEPAQNYFQKLWEQIKEYSYGTFEQRLETMLANSTNEKESQDFINTIMEKIAQGSQTRSALLVQYFDQIKTCVRNAAAKAGMDSRTFYKTLQERIPNELSQQLTRQGHFNDGKNDSRLTRGQMLFLLSYLEQTATYGNAITQKTISTGKNKGTVVINSKGCNIELYDRQHQANLIKGAMNNAEIALMQELRNMYAKWRTPLSVTHKTATGFEVNTPDPNYMPVKFYYPKGGLNIDVSAFDPFAEPLKERVAHDRDIDETCDILAMAYERAGLVATAVAWGSRSIDLRSILTREEVIKAMYAKCGKTFTEAFRRHLTDIMHPDGMKKTISIQAFNTLNEFATYSAMSWNISPPFKQTTSVLAYASILPDGLRGCIRHMLNFRENLKYARDLCEGDWFVARYGVDFSKNVGTIFKDIFISQWKDPSNNLYRKLMKSGLTGLQAGDLFGGIVVGTGYYKERLNQLVNQGIPLNQAKYTARAETGNFLEATQQSSQAAYMSSLQRGLGTIGNAVFKFTTSPMLQFSHEIHSLRMWQTTKNPKWRRKYLENLIVYHLVMPALLTIIDRLNPFRPDDDDPWWQDFVIAMLLGSMGGLLLIGSITQNLLTYMFQDKVGFQSINNGTIPAVKAATDVTTSSFKAAHSLTKTIKNLAIGDPDYAKDFENFQKHIIDAAVSVFHPFRAIRNVVKNNENEK